MKSIFRNTNTPRTRNSIWPANRYLGWRLACVVWLIVLPPACFAGGAGELFFSNSTLVISPDDEYVAFVPFEAGPVRTFNLRDGSLLRVFPVENGLTNIDISHDGRLIAAGTQLSLEPVDSVIRVWKVLTGELIGIKERYGVTRFVSFWEDASRLSFGQFGETQVWWEKPTEYWNFRHKTEEYSSPEPIPQSATITIGSRRSCVSVNYDRGMAATCAREAGAAILLTEIDSSDIAREIPETDTVRSLFFSADGSLLAAVISGEMSSVRLWETTSWNELPPVVVEGRAMQGALNSNGTLLAIHLHPHRLMIFDTMNRQMILSFSVRLVEEDLYQAAELGNVERVGELIRQGVNIDLPVGNGLLTPLLVAAGRGHAEVAKLLIYACADANRPNAATIALTPAVRSGDIETVKALVGAGADIEGRTESAGVGKTCLMHAVEFGSHEIASFLIDEGASLDAQSTNGYTALIYTVVFGRYQDKEALKNVQLLLEAGADANLRTWQNKTALDLANEKTASFTGSNRRTLNRIIRLLEQYSN